MFPRSIGYYAPEGLEEAKRSWEELLRRIESTKLRNGAIKKRGVGTQKAGFSPTHPPHPAPSITHPPSITLSLSHSPQECPITWSQRCHNTSLNPLLQGVTHR